MQLFRKLFLSGAAAGLLAALAPAAVYAAPVQIAQAGECHVSLTGTITRVISPTEFAMVANNMRVGSVHVVDTNARVNTHGLRLAPGNFAGVYGCFTNGQREFIANEVTLAGSESAYRSYNGMQTLANVGPCHVSLFGTVTENFANGVEFGMDTWHSGIGNIHVYDRDARVNANGLSVRPGVFAGIYGCFVQNGRAFHAEQITLAPSAQAYSSFAHPQVNVVGIVDEVRNGVIGMQTRYYGHVHVYTNQTGFRNGERISVQGTINPATGTINANTIAAI